MDSTVPTVKITNNADALGIWYIGYEFGSQSTLSFAEMCSEIPVGIVQDSRIKFLGKIAPE